MIIEINVPTEQDMFAQLQELAQVGQWRIPPEWNSCAGYFRSLMWMDNVDAFLSYINGVYQPLYNQHYSQDETTQAILVLVAYHLKWVHGHWENHTLCELSGMCFEYAL